LALARTRREILGFFRPTNVAKIGKVALHVRSDASDACALNDLCLNSIVFGR
jgi:hypothetical protein